MINNKKITVVMPAYNVEQTLEKTFNEIDRKIVDEVILVNDFSSDNTEEIANKLGITIVSHDKNKGYGAAQKTGYINALKNGADIVVLLHPDYQYTPKLIPAMSAMIAYEEYDFVVASRILRKTALTGGMPFYKFFANKMLTFFQNLLLAENLSEYHSGYKAYSRELLEAMPLEDFSNYFLFDNEILLSSIYNGFKVGEISCPTKYFKEASTMDFLNGCKYGSGVLKTGFMYFLAKLGIYKAKIFKKKSETVTR